MSRLERSRVGAAVFITVYTDILIIRDALNSNRSDLFYWPHLGEDRSLFIPSIVVLVAVLLILNGFCYYIIKSVQSGNTKRSSLMKKIAKVEKDAQKKSS